MGNQTAGMCALCPGGCPVAGFAPGVSVYCEQVQASVHGLAALLEAACHEGQQNLLPAALQQLRQTRRDLHEHVECIQGPGGLFEYIEDNAPQLVDRVRELCWQHEDMEQCLCSLERTLEGVAEQRAPDRIHEGAAALLAMIHQHQASAGDLMAAAYRA